LGVWKLSTSDTPIFHLAFPVLDLEATSRFFVTVLACSLGREDRRWIDFDFFGHQVTAHLCEQMPILATNLVDGKQVPASHFGLVLSWQRWHAVTERLKASGVEFLIEPYIRCKGQVGEQAPLFLLDPNGNAIELKAFRDSASLFAR
jgi:extradiol dioxygenase family protein